MKTVVVMVAMLLGLMVLASACSKVPAGHVGVKFNLYGSEKGVAEKVVGPGRYFLTWNEEMYLFPTFTQQYVWTKEPTEGGTEDESISFQTKEGLTVNGDFGIAYHIEPDKVVNVFQKYRRGVEEITDTFLRNFVRDSLNKHASSMTAEEVYSDRKVVLMDKVFAEVAAQTKDLGIIIEKLSLIGSFRLPEGIQTALNAKIEATQKALQAENEVKLAKAEAEKRIAAAAGEARANALLVQSLNPTLIKWEALKLERIKAEKWDGKNPQVMMGDKGGVLLNTNLSGE